MIFTPYAMHEPGGEDAVGLPVGSRIVFTELAATQGRDYRQWADRGITTIVRLNHSYGHGTIPAPEKYDEFAAQVENFVRKSRGANIWIVGNEWNLSVEWPPEGPITPEDYVACYDVCAAAILAAQPEGVVGPAAIGPWNIESGDWLDCYRYVLQNSAVVKAIFLHTYTHGSDPDLVFSDEKMETMPDRYYQFRAYRDFLDATPAAMLRLPIFITETGQDEPWENLNRGWVKNAYFEINEWNHATPHRAGIIDALALYRWPRHDDRYIEGLSGVISDMRDAIAFGYTIPDRRETPMPPTPEWVRIYRLDCESGFYNQGGHDELTIPIGTRLHYTHGSGQGDNPRPEADKKEIPQPEVYEGRYSATGFYISSEGQFGWVTEKIAVTPGKPLRADAVFMRVFHGDAAGGARLGICLGDGPFGTMKTEWPTDGPNPFDDPAIQYGPWRSSYPQDPGFIADSPKPDGTYEWGKVVVPETPHGVDFIRLVYHCSANERGEFSGFHADVMQVEMLTDISKPPTDPPAPTTCSAKILTETMAAAAYKKAKMYNEIGDMFTAAAENM